MQARANTALLALQWKARRQKTTQSCAKLRHAQSLGTIGQDFCPKLKVYFRKILRLFPLAR
jgi:hypothetical protein